MQDSYRILESGKSGKMTKKYQHHKVPHAWETQAWRKKMRKILHTFPDITILAVFCFISYVCNSYLKEIKKLPR